ncbi:protein phosphatase regulator gac1 [Metarhizium acridum]|nr:protein phosphatase regulator gac1 [Metarhizium acridum]
MDEAQRQNYGTANYGSVESPAPRHHAGAAAHHSLNLGHMQPFHPSFGSPHPASNTATATPKTMQEPKISSAMAPDMGRSTPPALAFGSGTPASDSISERFPWTTETHTATAIQG